MKKFKLLLLFLALPLITIACSTSGVANRAEGLSSQTSGEVLVYRTRTGFQSGNPEGVFVYMNDEQVGRMRTGANFKLVLKPGTYTFSIKASVMFLPAYTIATQVVNVEPGQTYYLRYHYGFAGLAGVHSTGSHSLALVSRQVGEALQ